MTTRVRLGVVCALAACASLSACDTGSKAPTGQVVATVDGSEITATDLRSELAGVNTSDPKQYEAARQRALQMLVMRKILAKAARGQQLDKTPDFAVQQQRADDVLLVQALQNKILTQVPTATREEAQSFMDEHPNIFAERKIFSLDQIATPPLPQSMERQIEPLNTLEEVEALLDKNHIPYRRGAATLDAVGADPNFVDRLVATDPHDLILLPGQQGWTINRIKDVKVQPFTGEPAMKYAIDLVTTQRKRDALSRAIYSTLAQGQTKVRYAAGYKPVTLPLAPPKSSDQRPHGSSAPAAAPTAAPAAAP